MTDKPASVRIATPQDAPAIYWLLLVDLQSDNSLGLPPDLADIARTVATVCNGEHGIAGIVENADGIVASIGIRASKPWFTSQWMLSQTWLFVEPENRKGGVLADDLFAFAEWYREEMSGRFGYEMIFENTVLSLNRLPAKLRLWKRHGEQIGGVFWRRVP